MRHTRRLVGLVVALMLTITAAACSRPDSQEETGRVLNIGATAEPVGMDMITTSGAAIPFVLLYNVYETLVKLDADGNIRPLLASEWTDSADGTVYTFTLQPDAKFASGAPVDADAVVASFERARSDAATEQIRSQWDVVDTIEATDAHTVTVTLRKPSNRWLYDLTGSAGIISDPTATDLATTPAGSGPYRFASWEQGSHVELTANDAYWGTAARFDDVFFRFYSDSNAMTTAMLSSQLDIISNLPVPTAVDQFSDASRFTVYEGSSQGEVVLGFNQESKALSDLKVRQAINHAIDRQALMDSVWGGKGQLIGSMVPLTDPWFEDLSDTYAYDPEAARALLKEAGYEDGLSITLSVPTLPYGPTSGRFIVAQLAEVGITVKLEELEWARWLDLVYAKHDYDMTIVAHVEPRDMRAFATEGNYWNYDNEQFNELLRQADEGTVEDQTTKLKEAARVLAEDAAADWLFLLPNIVIATTDISGIQANQVSMSFDLTTLAARN